MESITDASERCPLRIFREMKVNICLHGKINKTGQPISVEKIFIEFLVSVNKLEITCENVINRSIYQAMVVLEH